MKKKSIKNTLILFNEYIYNEIDLDSFKKEEIIIGNNDYCDIKLRIEMEDFEIKLINTSDYWQIVDSKAVYYVINGVKAKRKKLTHGDQIILKDHDKNELFRINFFLDFSSGKENYNRGIDITTLTEVKIGRATNNEIVIEDILVDEYHCLIKNDGENIYLIDLKSRYNVYLNGSKINEKEKIEENDFIIVCGYKFLYKENKIQFSNQNEKIKVLNPDIVLIESALTVLDYPNFMRTPRFIYTLPSEKVEIVAPPELQKKQGIEAVFNMIPMVGMALMSMFMMKGSSAAYQVGMLGVTLTSTVMLLVYNNSKIKKDTEKTNKLYKEYLEEKNDKIKELYSEQIKVLTTIHQTVEQALETVNNFDRRLWERSFKDEDFLEICIGTGTVPISFEVEVAKEEFGKREDTLILLPAKIKEKYKEIPDMPITINLKNNKSIGVIGETIDTIKFMKNLITQIVVYHYYEDVNIACICNEDELEDWKWIRWLPHVWNKNRKIRFMGVGKDSAHYVLEYLNEYLKMRQELLSSSNNSENILTGQTRFILMITDPKLLENEQISKLLESEQDLGITIIYLYQYIELLPKLCSEIISIKSDTDGEIITVKDSGKGIKFKYNKLKDYEYEELSRRMAPINEKKNFSENSLVKSITFYELYEVKSARQLPLLDNWKNNDVCKTMAAPLGVDIAGEVVALNLHEKYHGPHGLVAGTTGSGKSEILQSYILSLAVNFHPYDVSFILIDYKGGGMANLFIDLPHLIGTITNLDGNAVNRSLALIKSELKRRQRIFSKYDVNHIDGYKKLEKADSSLEPLPHLVIIADEFAELKTDQPEFMKELVSTARIGRSLGVHLILATQKPSGVVDDQIWSNSKFKLCLKVQDEADSNELLKKPDAASIVEPGRAYFQVGNNEIYQLFQSAWSGAKKYEDDDIASDDIEISAVSIEGARKVVYSSKEEYKDKKSITQLDDTVQQINRVFYANGYHKVDGCWVPPLEEVLYVTDILNEEEYFYNKNKDSLKLEVTPIVGIIDNPQMQKKSKFKYNFTEDGNLVILGASGYGKTTLLQTLILSTALTYSSKDVNMYILDFGTRTLKIFEELPQVGGVILSDDDDALRNFIMMIKKEIIRRKRMFSSYGASSLSNYRVASGNYLPHIIIMIDNYIAFKELFETYEDDIIFFSREGATLGISMVVTGTTLSTISFRMVSNFKMKTSFTCVDTSEYGNIFNKMGLKLTSLKGRALAEDGQVNEMQVALPGHSEEEVERISEINNYIRTIKEKSNGETAVPIPTIPDTVKLQDMIKEIEMDYPDQKLLVPCGFNTDDLENKYISLANYPLLTIVGSAKSGKSNMIKNIVQTFEKFYTQTEFVIFDSSNSGLRNIKENNNIKYYIKEESEFAPIFDFIETEGERRKEYVEDKMYSTGMDEAEIIEELQPLVVVVDNMAEFARILEIESLYTNIFNKLVKEYKNYGISVVFAGTEEGFKDYIYSLDFVKVAKDTQCGIILDSLESQNFFDVQLRYGTVEKEIKKGDGYLVLRNTFNRIKTPKCI